MNSMNAHRRLILCAVLLLAAAALPAHCQERHRLYTATNPSDTGGIRGIITSPHKPIVEVLAMPPDEPRFVYEGKVTGDHQGFLFESLPMGIYDLLIVYADDFYEGVELHPQPSTLTKEDLQKIEDIILASQPYFTKRVIHRVAGTTGRGNVARCLVTFLRDKESSGTTSHREGLEYMVNQAGLGWRRTFKLVWLKDVGPGWQVVQTRDLYPVWTDPAHALPKHHFRDKLSRIRVTDSIKDIGHLDLATTPLKPVAGSPSKPALPADNAPPADSVPPLE